MKTFWKRNKEPKALKIRYTKSAKNRELVDTLKAEIAQKLQDIGWYMVPVGFLDEPVVTALHLALIELRDENLIQINPDKTAHGDHMGFETWVLR